MVDQDAPTPDARTADARPADPSPPDGQLIGGRYRLGEVIGRGGMASVYRGHDELLGRTVAIKLFEHREADAEGLRRASSEVSLLASLNHHALVTLFDARVDGTNQAYFVMELVEGENLDHRIARGRVAATDVATMTVDLAEALHLVHTKGVVHRDVKPANVLLAPSHRPDREFRAKLADFGIAYLIDSTRVTLTGTLVGTAAYLSPEQALGRPPEAPSDIYSLGLVLLESLTGVREFTGSMVESVSARLTRDPEVPASVGPDWQALLTAMTAREPGMRPTALEVALAARSIEAGVPVVWGGSGTASGDDVETAAVGLMHGEARMPGSPAVEDEAGATREMPAATTPTQANAPTQATTPTQATQAMRAPVGPPDAGAAETQVFRVPGAVGAPAGAQAAQRPPASAVPPAWSAVSATPPAALRPTDAGPQSSARPGGDPARRRGAVVLVIAVLLVLAGVTAVLFGVLRPGASGDPAPTLPAVDGQLGTDLQQLLDTVTP